MLVTLFAYYVVTGNQAGALDMLAVLSAPMSLLVPGALLATFTRLSRMLNHDSYAQDRPSGLGAVPSGVSPPPTTE